MMETDDDVRQQRLDNVNRYIHRIGECVVEIQNHTDALKEELRLIQSNAIRPRSPSTNAKAIEEK